jgi:uncharacterized protein YdeI (YjbR/CyaY-like superfamily)
MGKRDSRVDAYIEKSADFARPILKEVRARVHEACPDCEETIKWGAPHFMYQGMLCGMAAFKAYCGVHFWKERLLRGAGGSDADTLARVGRIGGVADLPSRKDTLALVRKAMALNDEGVPVPRPPRGKAAPVRVPADLSTALGKNKKAKAAFDAFSPSHRREYVEWITEAKRDETRQKRLQTAVKWMAEGKSRNWKYDTRSA